MESSRLNKLSGRRSSLRSLLLVLGILAAAAFGSLAVASLRDAAQPRGLIHATPVGLPQAGPLAGSNESATPH
jgi:hypothetical protein